MKVLISTFAVLTFIVNISFAQHSTENFFKAPFISDGNSQQSMQSLMQNSEKDIVFIENLGQIRDVNGKKRPDVLFLTRSQGVDMYIISTGITYVFRKTEGDIQESAAMRKNKVEEPMPKNEGRQAKTSLHRLDMEFVGMNKNFNVKKELAIEQQFNYYTPEYPNGISPKGYKKITIENIYDGIDLVYYEKEGKMKYDFVVKAGADPNKIKMKYKGAGNVYIDKDGNVIATTPMGEIREEKPYTYSKNTGTEIESRYKLKGNVVLFDVAEYNKSEDIIIDPYRIWATYYGGGSYDEGRSICKDNSGNLYVTGNTRSSNFPTQTLTGAYNQTYGGGGDAFILKFNSSGQRLWATYYGGSSTDDGYGICTDNSNNLYVTGNARSSNFPTQTLTGSYNQASPAGDSDVFILKFNSNGVRLWATFYGGNYWDYGISICTDNSDNLYVTGETKSTNFPMQILAGAYNQITGGGGYDIFILKFNSSGARLWATYYGGGGNDHGRSICTDNSGNLYVTGYAGDNFPTKFLAGAYNQGIHSGWDDAFILKFDSSGARLWATYYGGSGHDNGFSICTDSSKNLYITGTTSSSNFPIDTLAGAYNQTTYGGGYDAFILKFNNSCARVWATYYGGSDYEIGYGICTDSSKNLYVTGRTKSNNFPTKTLAGAYNQNTYGGLTDAFVLKFNISSARLWATYYGGSQVDQCWAVCMDNTGNLYATGQTRSSNFPTQTLTGAYNQTTLGGSEDAFILKFNPTVGIKKISSEVPGNYSLYQNYPNPFNPTTNIRFTISELGFTILKVYDILGNEVATLVNEKLSAGSYEVDWNASGYTSGVYFYRLTTVPDGRQAGDYVETRKCLLIK